MSEKITIGPLKAIRLKCLDCMCGNPVEVRLCPCDDCSLYPYRFGHNPNRAGIGNTSKGRPHLQNSIQDLERSD